MNVLFKIFVYGTSILAMSQLTLVHAATQTCSIQARSNAVVLMFCPNILVEKAWIEAARAACTPGQPCNVWIWDDKTKMPSSAPNTDAELAKKHTAAAVAVWVNDAQNLIKLRKVRQDNRARQRQ